MARLAWLGLVATVAFAAVCDGGILDFKTLKVDLTDGKIAKTHAGWSPAEHLNITKEGLGWDGDGASSRDGWIQTKPLALGLSWRAPFAVSARVTIHPPPAETVLGNGQKYTPYGGDVYVRYSPDLKHWSTWQVLQHAEPQSQAEKENPGRHFAGTVRVPYRQRAEYDRLLYEYSKLDVPWKSDEEAAVRWILDRHPDFFSKHQPLIGYVEFLFEQDFRGGQRIRSFEASVSYGMSGTHAVPKDNDVYGDRNSSPWRFKAQEQQRIGKANPAEPLGALETFLGALASKNFQAAYDLVAPSSKKHGDPIAYHSPLDYKAFAAELSPHVEDDTAAPDSLRKFMAYELGKQRWESPDRFRVLVTLGGWDRDEVLLVRENGKWYVADPIHIIR